MLKNLPLFDKYTLLLCRVNDKFTNYCTFTPYKIYTHTSLA